MTSQAQQPVCWAGEPSSGQMLSSHDPCSEQQEGLPPVFACRWPASRLQPGSARTSHQVPTHAIFWLRAMGGCTKKLVLLPLHAIRACGSLHIVCHSIEQVWESISNMVHSLTSDGSVVLPRLEGQISKYLLSRAANFAACFRPGIACCQSIILMVVRQASEINDPLTSFAIVPCL